MALLQQHLSDRSPYFILHSKQWVCDYNLLTCCELLGDSGVLSRRASDGSEVHTVLWKLQVLASIKFRRLVLMGGFWCLHVCTSTQRAPLSIKSDYYGLQTSHLQVELDEYWSKCLFADCEQMGEKERVQNCYLNRYKKSNNNYTKKIVVHDHLWW